MRNIISEVIEVELAKALKAHYAKQYGLIVDDPDFYVKLDALRDEEVRIWDETQANKVVEYCPHCGQEL